MREKSRRGFRRDRGVAHGTVVGTGCERSLVVPAVLGRRKPRAGEILANYFPGSLIGQKN